VNKWLDDIAEAVLISLAAEKLLSKE